MPSKRKKGHPIDPDSPESKSVRGRAKIRTFHAELQEMRMKAAKDLLYNTKSMSGAGEEIAKTLKTEKARDPKVTLSPPEPHHEPAPLSHSEWMAA